MIRITNVSIAVVVAAALVSRGKKIFFFLLRPEVICYKLCAIYRIGFLFCSPALGFRLSRARCKLAFYLRFVHSITNRNWILIKSHLIHDCGSIPSLCMMYSNSAWIKAKSLITVESNSIHCTYTCYFHSSLQSAFIHLLHAITNNSPSLSLWLTLLYGFYCSAM